MRKLFHERTTSKLSVAVARNARGDRLQQPVTAPEIAEIRGVSSSSGVLQTLIERKTDQDGRTEPVSAVRSCIGTTREFLDRFGLNDITDCRKVEELSDALGSSCRPASPSPRSRTHRCRSNSPRRTTSAEPAPAEDETTVH